jgi:HAD superfamily hydrolase (TIGR01509 family)
VSAPTAEALRKLLDGKRLLIFDFDGTVADTAPLHAAAFAEVLAPLAVAVDYPSIAGLKTLDAMRVCLRQAELELPDEQVAGLVMAKQQRVRQMIAQDLQPLPGVDGFLRWARPRYRLAMVTSGSRGTVSLALEKLGYTRSFDPLICADDVAQAKPDPEGFLRALQITGVPAAGGLVFEDSDAGLQAARNAVLDVIDVRVFPWQNMYVKLPID